MKTVAAVGKISPVDNEASPPVRVMEFQFLKDRGVKVELAVIPQNRKDAS